MANVCEYNFFWCNGQIVQGSLNCFQSKNAQQCFNKLHMA